jgi:hypothetical protein
MVKGAAIPSSPCGRHVIEGEGFTHSSAIFTRSDRVENAEIGHDVMQTISMGNPTKDFQSQESQTWKEACTRVYLLRSVHGFSASHPAVDEEQTADGGALLVMNYR